MIGEGSPSPPSASAAPDLCGGRHTYDGTLPNRLDDSRAGSEAIHKCPYCKGTFEYDPDKYHAKATGRRKTQSSRVSSGELGPAPRGFELSQDVVE